MQVARRVKSISPSKSPFSDLPVTCFVVSKHNRLPEPFTFRCCQNQIPPKSKNLICSYRGTRTLMLSPRAQYYVGGLLSNLPRLPFRHIRIRPTHTNKQCSTGIEPVLLSPRPRSASGIEPPTLRERESNPRPLGYEPNALPLRYPAVLERIPRPCRYLFIWEFAERLNTLSWLRLTTSSQTDEASDIYKKDKNVMVCWQDSNLRPPVLPGALSLSYNTLRDTLVISFLRKK